MLVLNEKISKKIELLDEELNALKDFITSHKKTKYSKTKKFDAKRSFGKAD